MWLCAHNVVNVSEVHAASTFRAKVCMMESSFTYTQHCFEKNGRKQDSVRICAPMSAGIKVQELLYSQPF